MGEFSTWCETHLGGKNSVMAVWQIGLTWAPSPDLFNANFISDMEHLAKNQSSWTSRLARAASSHKSEDLTDECRSGRKRFLNQRGLTPRAVQNANPIISPGARACSPRRASRSPPCRGGRRRSPRGARPSQSTGGWRSHAAPPSRFLMGRP